MGQRGGARAVLLRSAYVTAIASNLGFAFGVLGPSIRHDLGLGRGALGLLSSLFFACTGIASIAAGRLVARWGTRVPATCALALTCLGCLTAAVTGRYVGLIVAAVVAGSGYSVVNVVTNRMVRSVAAPAELGWLMAVKTAGVPIATTLAAMVGAATSRWGWRPALGVLAVVAAPASLLAARTFTLRRPVATASAPQARLGPGFWLLPVAGFCAIAGSQPLYSWFATYLHDSLGVRTGTATLISGIVTATGIPSMLGAARLSDRLGPARRAEFLAGLCLVVAAALTVVLGAHAVGLASAIVAVAFGAAANLSFAGLFPALIVECAPGALERGTGVAMTGYFLGALASPVGFGLLSDTAGGYRLAWATACAVTVVGAMTFVVLGRRLRWSAGRPSAADPVPDIPLAG